MTLSFVRYALLAAAIALSHPDLASTQGQTRSWLDEPKPTSWNTSGASIPAAPKLQGAVNPRCRDAARPAELDEEQRLRDLGWNLVGSYQGGWQMVVIRATAGYDGMCRPRQFHDFVFVRGLFAGTLSPQPMDSRMDGALSRVSLRSSSELTAEYARYAAADPLCCPSRTTSVVFDIASDPPIVRPVSTSTSQLSAAASSPSPGLAGTSWRLVKFQGGDETILTPDDGTKYTIEFGAGGRLSARVDCNRGQGVWKSSGPNQIEFGPLALTRAQCPPGSLHDQIVKQWGNIRSYVIKDGHLFLSLMADGGIYEFQPVAK